MTLYLLVEQEKPYFNWYMPRSILSWQTRKGHKFTYKWHIITKELLKRSELSDTKKIQNWNGTGHKERDIKQLTVWTMIRGQRFRMTQLKTKHSLLHLFGHQYLVIQTFFISPITELLYRHQVNEKITHICFYIYIQVQQHQKGKKRQSNF